MIMNQNIIDKDIEYVLEENYMPYAVEAIVNRALPRVEDGFKPSHRKLLYTMFKMGLLKTKTKCANSVGQTMKLNPHGDGAIYETMVRLTDNNESLLTPYVKGKGNFGKVYSRDMAYAHQRYTESGLSDISNELFKDIDKNAIDFIDNYDETMKEPVLLPVTFPNILCNVTQGIAVGMASNICSFNLRAVCEATINYLENDELSNITLIPDFSTGGKYLLNEGELESINNSGRGKIVLRGVCSYKKDTNCIEITELPYTSTVEDIIDKVEELVKSKKTPEIIDIRDETDKGGLKVTIDLKRNTDVESLINKLYKFTALENTFSCNFNVLYEKDGVKTPKVMGTREIVEKWCEWRISCIKRELSHNLSMFEKDLHRLLGLQKITLDVNKTIEIIRKSKTDDIAIKELMSYFMIDKEQAEYVANMKLRNLNEESLLKQLKEIEDLQKKLENLRATIGDDRKVKKIISIQLEEIIKKYAIDRKTEVVTDYVDSKVIVAKEIDDYSCFVTVSKEGYVKKMLRTTDIENVKVKDNDEITSSWTTSNVSTLLIFTDEKNCYKLLLDDLETSTPSTLGTFLPTLLKLKDENIVSVQLADKEYSGFLINVYENNMLAKIPVESFKTKNKQSKLKNALSDANLVRQIFITEDIDLICVSSIDKVLLTNTSQFPSKSSKASVGQALMKEKDDSIIKDIFILDEIELDKIDDIEYYRGKRGSVGNFLKKTDTLPAIK